MLSRVQTIGLRQAQPLAIGPDLALPRAAASRMPVANFTFASDDRCCVGSVLAASARTLFSKLIEGSNLCGSLCFALSNFPFLSAGKPETHLFSTETGSIVPRLIRRSHSWFRN